MNTNNFDKFHYYCYNVTPSYYQHSEYRVCSAHNTNTGVVRVFLRFIQRVGPHGVTESPARVPIGRPPPSVCCVENIPVFPCLAQSVFWMALDSMFGQNVV